MNAKNLFAGQSAQKLLSATKIFERDEKKSFFNKAPFKKKQYDKVDTVSMNKRLLDLRQKIIE